MLKIEVNNNGYVEIEESGYGIRVTSETRTELLNARTDLPKVKSLWF